MKNIKFTAFILSFLVFLQAGAQELLVVGGPPGSGKSTLIEKCLLVDRDFSDSILIDADAFKKELGVLPTLDSDPEIDRENHAIVRQLTLEEIERRLRQGQDVIWPTTLGSTEETGVFFEFTTALT